MPGAMATKADLLRTRFRLNMSRVNAVLAPHLSAAGLMLPVEGATADTLRLAVVFLHATFEVALRSHLRKPDDTLTFSGRSDLEKALKRSSIDPKPFSPLYPPLIQMAKRRTRIVHEADLPNRAATTSKAWEFLDTWQLAMWLLAVPAFHNQMLIATNAANDVERTMYERLRKAMLKHVDFGKQMLALSGLPPERLKEPAENVTTTLNEMRALLDFKVSDFTSGERE